MVCLVLEKPLHVFGGQAIFVNGKAIAQTTSGNFCHTISRSLILGYIPTEYLAQHDFVVEAFGERSSAELITCAAYDPKKA
ncbi:MAG: hypothetical protein COB40_12390 [Marinosulfonomonas sp.]|nr:MAG: hypothetical protein COB40_12390 [Marinosulfonomonas sp.]